MECLIALSKSASSDWQVGCSFSAPHVVLFADFSGEVLKALYGKELDNLPPCAQLERVLFQPGSQQRILVSSHIWDRCLQEPGSAGWLSLLCRQQHYPSVFQRHLERLLEASTSLVGNEDITMHAHLTYFSDVFQDMDSLLPEQQQLKFTINTNSIGRQQTSASETLSNVSL